MIKDEVESLTSARKSAANGNEPSDSLRVWCPSFSCVGGKLVDKDSRL